MGLAVDLVDRANRDLKQLQQLLVDCKAVSSSYEVAKKRYASTSEVEQLYSQIIELNDLKSSLQTTMEAVAYKKDEDEKRKREQQAYDLSMQRQILEQQRALAALSALNLTTTSQQQQVVNSPKPQFQDKSESIW